MDCLHIAMTDVSSPGPSSHRSSRHSLRTDARLSFWLLRCTVVCTPLTRKECTEIKAPLATLLAVVALLALTPIASGMGVPFTSRARAFGFACNKDHSGPARISAHGERSPLRLLRRRWSASLVDRFHEATINPLGIDR
jgi:hypothetical protein